MGIKETKQRVLIVEDEASIRDFLVFALSKAGYIVSQAEDGCVAIDILNNEKIDIILLDWMLPGESGVQITKRLRKDNLTSHIPIIMLTAKAEEDNKVRALQQGVDDYIVKPFSPKELVARVQAVLRRGPLKKDDDVLVFHDMVLNHETRELSISGNFIKTSPIEYRFLRFLMKNPHRVYSREQLLHYVWESMNMDSDERTVDVHVRRVRKLVEPYGYDKYIKTVRGSGYRLTDKQV